MTTEAYEPTRQAFGSSGGKTFLAKEIAPLVPEHKTYVEPYAGGAALYFYKEPVAKEVLNDKDKEVAFAYRFIRDMTEKQYEQLKRKDWVINRKRFDKVKQIKSRSAINRFYKFYYLKKASFLYRNSSVNVGRIGDSISIEHLPDVKKRLRGVAVNSSDAIAMINKHDASNTFFYLDPPYPNTAKIAGNAPNFTEEDLRTLTDRLKHIKGKFILSMDKGNKGNIPKRFTTKEVLVPIHNKKGQTNKLRRELLIANFPIRRIKRVAKVLRRRGRGKTDIRYIYDTPSGYQHRLLGMGNPHRGRKYGHRVIYRPYFR